MKSLNLYNLEALIDFRHDLHKHPELAFQEFRTNTKILEYLSVLGVPQENIRQVAQTGILVDIKGTAPPSGKPFCIALRADMDGLPIKEENPEILYQSITEAAHMCGHDMHVTCLLGGASKLLEKIEQIPSDKKLRLIFQPAEEATGGAYPMIQEGAMEGVDEVYGFHNEPWDKPGKLYIMPGFVMARCTTIEIKIIGEGGHAARADQLNDPLQPAADIHVEIRKLIKEYRAKGFQFVLCLPYIKTGNAMNAISDTCEMRGILRTYDEDFCDEIKERLRKLIEEACHKFNCKTHIDIKSSYPAVYNCEKETENVIRVGKKVFGEENISQGKLPLFGGEDFSYFSKEKPGAFFFLSSSKNGYDMLHTNRFDANDDLIPLASEMWLRLVEDRFGLTFQ